MSALPFILLDLDAHTEAELLMALGRVNLLSDAGNLARGRGERAYARWIKENCREMTRLMDFIADTPARSPEALRAKVEWMVRDVDPEEPSFRGIFGGTLSALWDVLQSGRLD